MKVCDVPVKLGDDEAEPDFFLCSLNFALLLHFPALAHFTPLSSSATLAFIFCHETSNSQRTDILKSLSQSLSRILRQLFGLEKQFDDI